MPLIRKVYERHKWIVAHDKWEEFVVQFLWIVIIAI